MGHHRQAYAPSRRTMCEKENSKTLRGKYREISVCPQAEENFLGDKGVKQEMRFQQILQCENF